MSSKNDNFEDLSSQFFKSGKGGSPKKSKPMNLDLPDPDAQSNGFLKEDTGEYPKINTEAIEKGAAKLKEGLNTKLKQVKDNIKKEQEAIKAAQEERARQKQELEAQKAAEEAARKAAEEAARKVAEEEALKVAEEKARREAEEAARKAAEEKARIEAEEAALKAAREAQAQAVVPEIAPEPEPEFISRKSKKGNKKSAKGLWALACVLIAIIIGGCVWFFLFYTQRTVDEVEEAAQAGSAVAADLKTPDLAFNDLHGPVQYARVGSEFDGSPYFYKEYMYDEQGNWVNVPDWIGNEKNEFIRILRGIGGNPMEFDGKKVSKDDAGYIEEYVGLDYMEGGTELFINVYRWDDGVLNQSGSSNVMGYFDAYDNDFSDIHGYQSQSVYSYDDKGNLIKKENLMLYGLPDDPYQSSETEEYSYLSFDDYGNWLKRIVTRTTTTSEGYPRTYNTTEVREITYHN